MRVAVSLILLTASAFPQTPSSDSLLFHAAAKEVLVEAIVTDNKGVFQSDLKASEFHLFEDGKEQPITSFALESNAPAKARHPHFIALVIDIEDPAVHDRLLDFVDRYASPNLYIALYSRSGDEARLLQPLTTDAERLKTAIRAMPPITGSPMKGVLTHERMPIFDRVRQVAADLAPIHGRKGLVLFNPGLRAFRYVRSGPTDSSDAPIAPITPPRPMPQNVNARYPLGIFDWVPKTAEDCNNAGVSVYAFAIGKDAGVSAGEFYKTGGGIGPDVGGATDMIRDLAVATGGRYTPPGAYDLGQYLASVVKEQTDYYLIAYSPRPDSLDRPCRNIKLKVDRPGLDIVARDQVCATAPSDVRSLKPRQRALEARLSKPAPGNVAASAQISWYHVKPGAAIVDVAADLGPAAIKLRGKNEGDLELLEIVYREDGSVAARLPDTVKLNFGSPAQRAEAAKWPYHYSTQFALPPGRYRFRLGAGSDDASVAIVERPLDIEPWAAAALSVSAIEFGVEDRAANSVDEELDPALTDSPHRPIAKGRELIPMGSSEFPAGREGMFYFEIYAPDPTPLTLTVRILDEANAEQANSGPLDVAQWIEPGRDAIPVALTLPIAKLPPAKYTLEVRVSGEVLSPAVRTAAFEVK